MRKIFKYKINPIAFDNKYVIPMPDGAEILSAQRQGGGDDIYIWAIVDEKNPLEDREVIVFGTGMEIPLDLNLRFINTVQIGWLVFHVFEALE